MPSCSHSFDTEKLAWEHLESSELHRGLRFTRGQSWTVLGPQAFTLGAVPCFQVVSKENAPTQLLEAPAPPVLRKLRKSMSPVRAFFNRFRCPLGQAECSVCRTRYALAQRRYQRSQNQLGVPWESLLPAYTEVQTRDRPISCSELFLVDMEFHWGDQSAQCTGPALL